MRTKIALACLMIIFLAVSIANANASEFNLTFNKTGIPQEDLSKPSINIKLIKVIPATPGNSKPVNLSVSVVYPAIQKYICGLNESNFKINTLIVAPYGAPVAIKTVLPISTIAKNNISLCSYWISIVPATYQGKQYIWKNGSYTIELDYIVNGQQLANTTVNFRM